MKLLCSGRRHAAAACCGAALRQDAPRRLSCWHAAACLPFHPCIGKPVHAIDCNRAFRVKAGSVEAWRTSGGWRAAAHVGARARRSSSLACATCASPLFIPPVPRDAPSTTRRQPAMYPDQVLGKRGTSRCASRTAFQRPRAFDQQADAYIKPESRPRPPPPAGAARRRRPLKPFHPSVTPLHHSPLMPLHSF